MADHIPYADLFYVGAGHHEGQVHGYPDAHILYVMTSTPSEKLVGLWQVYTDDGTTLRRIVGSGIMHQRDGAWSGQLLVGKKERWHLSAVVGSPRVEMRATAEMEA